MVTKLKNAPISRLTSSMLTALLLVALTAPFVMLQSLHVFAAAAALPCTVGNYNGCTELSATPPEDIPAVPPNMVLMFDDSGSMDYDYMPDWLFLQNQTQNGVRDSLNNSLYYDPTKTYTPPPKADGSAYPNSPGLTQAYLDGFNPVAGGSQNVTTYASNKTTNNGTPITYWTNLPTTLFDTDKDYGAAVWGGGTAGGPGSPGVPAHCPAGYNVDPSNSAQCIRNSVPPTQVWKCTSGDSGPTNHLGDPHACRHAAYQEGTLVYTWYTATQYPSTCPGTSVLSGSSCVYPPVPLIPATDPTDPTLPTADYKWTCPSGGAFTGTPAGPPSPAPECMSNGARIYVKVFTYTTGAATGPYTLHYVASGTDCDNLYYSAQKNVCVNEALYKNAAGDVAAPATDAAGNPLTAGQNVANWFSYYRTRLLMAKTGLMTGLSKLDPGYRFGFASINGNGTSAIPAGASSTSAPYSFDDSMVSGTGGNANNKLAVVQPFGDGSSGTQKANFWNWLAAEKAQGETPLRKALNAAGQYYQTDQPWSAMKGDPGYTGKPISFTCRASYTILTTDGFWNGDDPGVSGMANAADSDGTIQTVPSGNAMKQYLAKSPFGGAVGGSAGAGVSSLADVATYYWENDLQPGMANEVAAGSSDPATWQHMTTYTIGLGFQPVNIQPSTATIKTIFGWAHALDGGLSPNPDPADASFLWPTPASNSVNNIADLVHTAVNGRGDYFNVTNPTDLANAFTAITAQISARAPKTAAAANSSVLALGAVTFQVGYDTSDWHGSLQAIALKTDGSLGAVLWDAGAQLDAAYHSATGYPTRTVYTGAYSASGTYSAFQFNSAHKASLDSTETAGLQSPALAGGTDTLDNRINYLLGDPTYEGAKLDYRDRTSILGAILHSDPVYVAGAAGKYRDSWPTFGTAAAPIKPPENVIGAQTFASFVSAEATRPSMVYLAANDGMLHAFYAPVPTCTGTIDGNGDCSAYTFPSSTNQGTEAWAFVPRAAYANLGNLTTLNDFKFRPTVDATPVTRDVFFSGGGANNNTWRTILTGSVGLGGRGVYALDITDPSSFSKTNVLWEFDSDMTVASTCASNDGACNGNDLGYTMAQPNVGRLSNGEWVVLVPNGYFPDCTTPDYPTADEASCKAIAAQAPKDASGKPYSALFVLDAQTGKVIAELKTPTGLGVTSFGLAKPVLGDYNSDQVDDVAFAGDVQGNLWRFDLSDPDPTKWAVSLVYKGLTDANGNQGVQPITTMPRLFPDPTTNRFMVLFGTGKYLGVGDNSNSTVQAIIAVRDVAGTTYSQADMTQQYLHETLAPATLPDGSANPIAGASLRCITGSSTNDCTTTINAVASSAGGWFVNLYTTASDGTRNNAGERVVVNPAAIFSTNTVIFQSLITGSQSADACNPSTQGAILALNATTGGSGGVPSLGGVSIAGGRISNARTSGSLPILSGVGGANAYVIDSAICDSSKTHCKTFPPPVPNWRRRSWRVLLNDQ